MKKITSLIVALIFTISIGLAVINSANSVSQSSGQNYATIAGPPPSPPQKPGSGE